MFSNEYSVYEENSKIWPGLISFSCTKIDVYLFEFDQWLSSFHIYLPQSLVLHIALLNLCVPSQCPLTR